MFVANSVCVSFFPGKLMPGEFENITLRWHVTGNTDGRMHDDKTRAHLMRPHNANI